MKWLENIITAISPERGAKREAWRQYRENMRNYDAGSYERLNAGWRAVNDSAEYTDRNSRDAVRARARDLERNSDLMNSVIGAFKRNIYGGGYALQPKTGNDGLNDTLKDLWVRWCKKENCDVTGTQSFDQIMRMCIERKKVDGGVLIVKRYTDQGFIPFQLQVFEVDELYDAWMTTHGNGNKVVGGIEYNAYNRPVGYWIKQYDIDGVSLDPVYIEAKDVIFYFSKKRPSQIREMSDMSQTITRIRDTNEFLVAVAVKQRIEACLSVFIKREYPPSGLGRNGNSALDPARTSYDGKTITPGMIRELNMGDGVEVVNPSGQATDAASFVKLLQRMVGAGQGLSYEATSRDMSQTNYSSARQGSIEDELTYQEDVELLMDVMDEIYEAFVTSCYLAKLINPRNFLVSKEKYLAHTWVKAPKKWIDPYKEAMANKIALNTGQKSYKQICAENGRDYKEQIDEIAEVLEYARDKGIEMGGVIFGQDNYPYPEADSLDDEGNSSGGTANQSKA